MTSSMSESRMETSFSGSSSHSVADAQHDTNSERSHLVDDGGQRWRWPDVIRSNILRFWKAAVIICAPLFLLPLAVSTQEAKAGYVICIVAIFWVTEVTHLAAVALLPLFLFPMLGILTAKDAAASYFQDATLLFVGGLIVAVAVEKWRLHERIALRALLLMGMSKSMLLLGFMSITGFLSMWISNTASTAMMLPIAQAVLDELDLNESECEQERTEAAADTNGSADDVPVAPKPRASDPNFKKGMMLAVAYGASIGGIATLTGTGPNLVLTGQLTKLFPRYTGLSFGKWFLVGLPTSIILVLLGWLWLSFLFDREGGPVRLLLRRIRSCFRHQVYTVDTVAARAADKQSKEAIRGMIRERYIALGKLSFAEAVILIDFTILVLAWFLRHPVFMPGWGELFPETDTVPKRSYVSDSTAAILFSTILFFVPSKWPFSAAARSSSEPTKRILEWDMVHEKLPWGVVILLGGGFCLAEGATESNLSCWFGLQLKALDQLDIRLVLFVIVLFVTFFTEVASNTASATIFLPILAQLAAVTLRQNPFWLMLPATISCSFAFMLPAATPPNAIAFSYRHLRVTDMVKAGIVMNFIGIAVVLFIANTLALAVFNLNEFPAWAHLNDTESSACGLSTNSTGG